jgi:hypothetical protein
MDRSTSGWKICWCRGCVCWWGWDVGGLLVLAGSVVVVVELFALSLVTVTPLELKSDGMKIRDDFKSTKHFFKIFFAPFTYTVI